MQVLYSQFSGLVGLVIFLMQMWKFAPAERAGFTAAVAGMLVYLLLNGADLIVRKIIAHVPQESETKAPPPPAAEPRRERHEHHELATA